MQALRTVIAAALSPEKSQLSNLPETPQMATTLHALRLMGCRVSDGQGVANYFRPVRQEDDRVIGVPCQESPQVLKLLLPVGLACRRNIRYDYGEDPALPEAFLDALREGGAKLFVRKGKVYARKGIAPKLYDLQSITDMTLLSGMLLALPLLGPSASLQLPRCAIDSREIHSTIAVLREFGVQVVQVDTLYCVTGTYRPASLAVEGDWRLAAFWLATGVINGIVRVDGVNAVSPQPQCMFFHVLKEMSAAVQSKEPPKPAVRSTSGGMIGGPVDLAKAPDLFPLLAATACFAKGSTIIKALPNTHGYASTMHELVKALGGSSIETETGLMVRGVGLHGRSEEDAQVDCQGDVSVALAIIAAAGGRSGRVILHGAECVEDAYPGFFLEYRKAGGQFTLMEDDVELPPKENAENQIC